MTEVSEILKKCKSILEEHYQARLQAIFLYGSAARKELMANSDIDLLVVLPGPFDYGQELRTIVELLYPLQLEASHWISASPAEADKFMAATSQLYRNIHQEGIKL